MEKAYVTLTTKSWHYKLMKLVLGGATPTPQNMHNLCPYFWLLVFSLLTCWVVIPVRFLLKVGNYILTTIEDLMDKAIITPAADSWADKLSDIDAYQIWNHHREINTTYRKVYEYEKGGYEKDRFVRNWYEKKYGFKAFKENATYWSQEFTPEFTTWLENSRLAYTKWAEEERARIERENAEPSYSDKLEDFRDNVGEFFGKVSAEVASWKNIIAWTKRIVGAIVTGLLLIVTYFIVNIASKGILWLVDHWDWKVVLGTVCVLAAIALFVGFLWLINKLYDYITAKGTSIWWVKVISSFLYWCVWMPVRFIFYTVLWQLVIVNLAFFVVAGSKAAWFGILGFLGIFGEYAGASYTDYCPGVSWVENQEVVTPVNNVVTPVAPEVVPDPEVAPVAPVDPSTGV